MAEQAVVVIAAVFLLVVLLGGLAALSEWLNPSKPFLWFSMFFQLAAYAYVLVVLIKGSLIILYTPIPGW